MVDRFVSFLAVAPQHGQIELSCQHDMASSADTRRPWGEAAELFESLGNGPGFLSEFPAGLLHRVGAFWHLRCRHLKRYCVDWVPMLADECDSISVMDGNDRDGTRTLFENCI
jgi:hypothetical protein